MKSTMCELARPQRRLRYCDQILSHKYGCEENKERRYFYLLNPELGCVSSPVLHQHHTGRVHPGMDANSCCFSSSRHIARSPSLETICGLLSPYNYQSLPSTCARTPSSQALLLRCPFLRAERPCALGAWLLLRAAEPAFITAPRPKSPPTSEFLSMGPAFHVFTAPLSTSCLANGLL